MKHNVLYMGIKITQSSKMPVSQRKELRER